MEKFFRLKFILLISVAVLTSCAEIQDENIVGYWIPEKISWETDTLPDYDDTVFITSAGITSISFEKNEKVQILKWMPYRAGDSITRGEPFFVLRVGNWKWKDNSTIEITSKVVDGGIYGERHQDMDKIIHDTIIFEKEKSLRWKNNKFVRTNKLSFEVRNLFAKYK